MRFTNKFALQTYLIAGGSSGLVVKGGDSQSDGCEFESLRCILDGHFSYLFVVRIVMFVWKDKNKWKRGRVGPFFQKTYLIRHTQSQLANFPVSSWITCTYKICSCSTEKSTQNRITLQQQKIISNCFQTQFSCHHKGCRRPLDQGPIL